VLSNLSNGDLIECGCDEAGRGCLAGPVFAAAVILPPDFFHPLLNDSKQVNEKNRYLLRDVIIKSSVAWAYASVDNDEIDKINILKASIKAMHLAIDKLETIPQYLIIDGNRFKPYKKISLSVILNLHRLQRLQLLQRPFVIIICIKFTWNFLNIIGLQIKDTLQSTIEKQFRETELVNITEDLTDY
jgi:hypothetical protein